MIDRYFTNKGKGSRSVSAAVIRSPSLRLGSRLISVLLTLLLVALTPYQLTMAGSPTEQELTVAFLFNFLKFTEWPKLVNGDDISICLTNDNFLGEEIKAIAGRTAQGKTVRIDVVDIDDELKGCQLLFFPREEKPLRVREWLKKSGNLPVLTVSNSNDFLEIGGMIVLLNDGARIQFEVNLEPVKRVGLQLSSQLLALARNVKGK